MQPVKCLFKKKIVYLIPIGLYVFTPMFELVLRLVFFSLESLVCSSNCESRAIWLFYCTVDDRVQEQHLYTVYTVILYLECLNGTETINTLKQMVTQFCSSLKTPLTVKIIINQKKKKQCQLIHSIKCYTQHQEKMIAFVSQGIFLPVYKHVLNTFNHT